MKRHTAYLLIALVVAGTAGIVWAAQPAVDQPAAQAPAPAEIGTVAPAEAGTVAPAEIEGLFVDPIDQDTGACCRGRCFSEKITCKDECAIGDQICLDQCVARFNACIANC